MNRNNRIEINISFSFFAQVMYILIFLFLNKMIEPLELIAYYLFVAYYRSYFFSQRSPFKYRNNLEWFTPADLT